MPSDPRTADPRARACALYLEAEALERELGRRFDNHSVRGAAHDRLFRAYQRANDRLDRRFQAIGAPA